MKRTLVALATVLALGAGTTTTVVEPPKAQAQTVNLNNIDAQQVAAAVGALVTPHRPSS